MQIEKLHILAFISRQTIADLFKRILNAVFDLQVEDSEWTVLIRLSFLWLFYLAFFKQVII